MNRQELHEMLRDRVGISIGEFPGVSGFPCLHSDPAGKEERLIEKFSSLDFVLLSDEVFFLSHLGFVLKQVEARLAHHGLLVVHRRERASATRPDPLVHRILGISGMEYVSDFCEQGGEYFVFRLVRNETQAVSLVLDSKAMTVKPLRYRLVDSVNEFLSSFPWLKAFLKRVFA